MKEAILIRADFRTGTVLDDNYRIWVEGGGQTKYTRFDSLESAIACIDAEKGARTNVEFHVQIDGQTVYTDVSPQDLTTPLHLTPNFRQRSEDE